MPDGRFKRLRQYKKIYQISHKKLIGRHVLTAHEKEVLKYLQTMAAHTAFTKAMNMTLGDLETHQQELISDIMLEMVAKK